MTTTNATTTARGPTEVATQGGREGREGGRRHPRPRDGYADGEERQHKDDDGGPAPGGSDGDGND